MNLFQLVKQGTDTLGTEEVRFYEFARAPDGCATPYATWQIVAGEPQNRLSGSPTHDLVEAQIDIWGTDAPEARTVARAVRRALDSHINITHYVSGWDEESALYRITCRCTYLTEI